MLRNSFRTEAGHLVDGDKPGFPPPDDFHFSCCYGRKLLFSTQSDSPRPRLSAILALPRFVRFLTWTRESLLVEARGFSLLTAPRLIVLSRAVCLECTAETLAATHHNGGTGQRRREATTSSGPWHAGECRQFAPNDRLQTGIVGRADCSLPFSDHLRGRGELFARPISPNRHV